MECTVHKLVADVAPLSAGRVLLVKYGDTSTYDHQKGWFLPDDFLSWEEHPTAAAKRILQEQAGLSGDYVRWRASSRSMEARGISSSTTSWNSPVGYGHRRARTWPQPNGSTLERGLEF